MHVPEILSATKLSKASGTLVRRISASQSMMADEGGGVEVMSPGQPVADENVNPDGMGLHQPADPPNLPSKPSPFPLY